MGRAAHSRVQGRADTQGARIQRGGRRSQRPAVAAKLREAFKVAVASPEFAAACAKIDAPVMYLDAADYEKYVGNVYKKETVLIERLKLKELIAKG